jgi:hypothetical protein
MSEEYVFATSKLKLLRGLVIMLAFVACACYLLSLSPDEIAAQRRWNNPLLLHALGYATLLLFGLGGLAIGARLFDRKPGLVLGPEGVLDNSSAVSCGFVPWSDIAGFGTCEIRKQKMVVVYLYDPERYLARSNPFMRPLKRASARMVGSPLSLGAHGLDVDFDELLQLFDRYYQRYGTTGRGTASGALAG